MADAGEGLIDAQNRIQERMDEREEERARRAVAKKEQDRKSCGGQNRCGWRTRSSAASSSKRSTKHERSS